MSAEKQANPLFVRYGIKDYVETGSTGTNLVNYGTSICGAGIFTLPAPAFLGAEKTLILNSSNSEIQTESSATVFSGTTYNRIAATTLLDDPVFVMLKGASTAAWYVNQQWANVAASTAGGVYYTVAAATQA